MRLLWGALIDGLITTYDHKQGQDCHPVLLLVDEAGRTAPHALRPRHNRCGTGDLPLGCCAIPLPTRGCLRTRPRPCPKRQHGDPAYYRPANLDTADYLEHALGRVSEYAHSQTKRQGTEDSSGLLEQGVPLMTAGEIKQMGDEDIIAFHRNLPPMKLKRIDWRQNRELIQKRQIAPPQITPLPQLTDIQIRTTDPLTEEIIDPDRID